MMHVNFDVIEKQKIMQNLTIKCIQNYENILKANRRQFTIHYQYKKIYNEHVAKKKYQKKETLKRLKIKFFENNCFEFIKQFASFDFELLFNTYILSKKKIRNVTFRKSKHETNFL